MITMIPNRRKIRALLVVAFFSRGSFITVNSLPCQLAGIAGWAML
ncbi:MAG: hypothetical protein ABI220_05905 [Candidatus Saccharimonadales bacterium]